MHDVTEAIQPKSDQLNADDLIGSTLTSAIESVIVSQGDQPITIKLTGHARPWKPCKSMGRVLAMAWGKDSRVWVGRSVTLFCDPSVTWAGVSVGGIRVSHLSHIKHSIDMSLTASKGKRKPFKVDPLVIAEPKPYPPKSFAEKLPAMRAALESGKMTPAAVIAQCEKTGTLTNEQKAAINAPIEKPTETTGDEY